MLPMPGRAEPAKQGLPSGSWNLEEILFYCQRQSPGVCRENTPTSVFAFSFLGGIYHWPKPGRSQALRQSRKSCPPRVSLQGTEQGKEGRHWVGLGRAAEGE